MKVVDGNGSGEACVMSEIVGSRGGSVEALCE